ncbi:hypothetical protein, partial [Mycobacterium attenuatum]|uniref:hypothetical protein n=1 Tax=Mycobacterium attenuatum TaxID=2341086 RepID=UPI001B7D540E
DDDSGDDQASLRHPLNVAAVKLFRCLDTPHSYVLTHHTATPTEVSVGFLRSEAASSLVVPPLHDPYHNPSTSPSPLTAARAAFNVSLPTDESGLKFMPLLGRCVEGRRQSTAEVQQRMDELLHLIEGSSESASNAP